MGELITSLQSLSDVGLVVLLFLVLFGGSRKWWVWGWQLAECEARSEKAVAAEREIAREWKEIALPSVQSLETAVKIASRRKGSNE